MTIYRLGCIFHNKQVVPVCNFHYFIHITCHSGIMNRNNNFSFRCNKFFNFILINTLMIGSAIDKNNLSPLPDKSKSG